MSRSSVASELYKDKIEVSLDNRQIFYLFFGGSVIVGLVFVLGIVVGRRVEARAHIGRAQTQVATDPLAALDRLAGGAGLTFQGTLRGASGPTSNIESLVAQTAKAQRADDRNHLNKTGERPAVNAVASSTATDHDPNHQGNALRQLETLDHNEAASEKGDSKKPAKLGKADGKKADDKKSELKVEDKKPEDKKSEDKKPDDKKIEVKVSDPKPADKKVDDKKLEEVKVEDKKTAEKKADDKKLEAKKLEDRKAEDRKVEAKKLDDKKIDDKKSDDKKLDDTKVEDKKTADKKIEDKKTEDKKIEDKKADDKTGKDKKSAKFALQLSSFQSRSEAEAYLSQIKGGFGAYITEGEVSGKTYYRVRIGNYRSLDAANDAKIELEKATKRTATVMKL